MYRKNSWTLSDLLKAKSLDEFTKEKNRIPADAYELLQWIADGYDADEVIEAFYNEENKSDENLKKALDSAENRYNFYVVEGEQELREIMAHFPASNAKKNSLQGLFRSGTSYRYGRNRKNGRCNAQSKISC